MSRLALHQVRDLISRGKRVLSVTVALFVLAGLVLAITLPPTYEAVTILARAESDDFRDASGLPGQLASVASLAGLGVNAGGVETSIAVLSSRRFTNRFLEQEGVLPELFPELWDSDSGTWRKGEPSAWGRFRAWLSSLLAKLSGDRGGGAAGANQLGPPSWEAYRRFSQLRSVSQDTRTGLITVSIQWKDPQLAARWANLLVERANEQIRADAILESRQRQRYLEEQLAQVSIVGLREALFRISESEQRKAMLATVRKEFAFRVIDPAVVPGERVSPRRTLLVVSMFIVGAFVGIAILILREILSAPSRGSATPHARGSLAAGGGAA
jgi:uncharacterized protein involved in exopolysaccharide biosynthesis